MSFKEDDHPRSDDGKFGSGGSKSKKNNDTAQTVKISGDELGSYSNIEELRSKAVDFYKQNLQGKSVENPKLGEVMFSRKGLEKFRSSSGSEDKLKMVVALKDIVKHGEYQGVEELTKTRNDGFVRFHRINKEVELSGKKYKTSLLVGEDRSGRKFYNLNDNADTYTKDNSPEGYLCQKRADEGKSTPEGICRAMADRQERLATASDRLPSVISKAIKGCFATGNILQSDDGINIKITRIRDMNIAMDTRHKDDNGYLHVGDSNLTKAQVADYFGYEIPGCDELSLSPDKIYKVYRPAEELEAAVNTFNGIPILIKHKEDSAFDPQKALRVGATGTDATFDGTYITNTLVFHDAQAIELIESGEQKELSAGYRYTPVVESGEFEGIGYDIKMTDISANHIAIVENGRAGSDVVVADKAINKGAYIMKKLDRLKKFLGLAMDAEPEEVAEKLEEALEEVKELEKEDEASTSDAEPTLGDILSELENALAPLLEGHDAEAKTIKAMLEKVKNGLAATEASDEEATAEDEDETAKDEDEPEKAAQAQDSLPKTRKKLIAINPAKIAMDAEARIMAKFAAKEKACEAVQSLVGVVRAMSFDSAEAIYAFALTECGLNPKDYPASSYKGMVDAIKLNGRGKLTTIAQDSLQTLPAGITVDFDRFKTL